MSSKWRLRKSSTGSYAVESCTRMVERETRSDEVAVLF